MFIWWIVKKTTFICYANFRTLLFIMCPESRVKHSSPKFTSPMLKIQFTLMCWIDNAWASDYLSSPSLLYILAIGKQVENSIENQRKLLQFVFRVSSKVLSFIKLPAFPLIQVKNFPGKSCHFNIYYLRIVCYLKI